MRLTKRKRQILREFVDYRCEECKIHEDKVGKLILHRIKRGNAGGEYSLRNIKMVCRKCHRKYHSGEFK